MKVKVKLKGILASSAGFREREIEMPEGTTVAEALNIINLPVSGEWTKSSVNGRLRGKSCVLNDGDELLFFPVGGAG